MNGFTRLLILGMSLIVASTVYAAPATYQIHVDGLACPFCAYGLEKRLKKVDGVQEVEADIGTGTVTVTMAEGKALGQEDARKAVKKAGFTMGDFKELTPAEAAAPEGRAKE